MWVFSAGPAASKDACQTIKLFLCCFVNSSLSLGFSKFLPAFLSLFIYFPHFHWSFKSQPLFLWFFFLQFPFTSLFDNIQVFLAWQMLTIRTITGNTQPSFFNPPIPMNACIATYTWSIFLGGKYFWSGDLCRDSLEDGSLSVTDYPPPKILQKLPISLLFSIPGKLPVKLDPLQAPSVSSYKMIYYFVQKLKMGTVLMWMR